MDKIIKKILVTIENAGFEAYLVGGYVRDYLLGIKSFDVDICTSALPKDLHKLFPNNSNSNSYGGFNLKIKKYNIDITTYRKELNYENRKPIEVEYVKKLDEDIIRRDFTINSICMDKNEKIIDLLGGVNDLNNHEIRMYGDILKKIQDDPLRILRGIRFASILDFNLSLELKESFKNNYELVSNLSLVRIKEEMNKILLNRNFKKGLSYLKEFHILELLGITYDEVFYVNDICGMWAQLNFSNNYAFTKQELANIINIRQIINEGTINNNVLYKYGLYISLVSGEILNIKSREIHFMYNKLPIKNDKDLDITNEEIISILNIRPSKEIKIIRNELVDLVLNKKIKNKNKDLRNYVLKRKE